MITIQELLYNRGLDPKAKVKLVRQTDQRFDVYKRYKDDYPTFIKYQNEQSKPVYKNVDYIVSFVGEEGSLARFIGVFQVLDCKTFTKPKKGVDGGQYSYLYDMKEVKGYEDLQERVIIDWGKSTLSWHQWIKNHKGVVEIQPGLHYRQFKDYFDFILDYQELKEIITNEYKDWKRTLSITNGIYLIHDTKTGMLYVGTTYNKDGIWGRWKTYVKKNGSGGNKALDELISKDKNYANNFKFSILMLLPSTITEREAVRKEQLFKEKLGSRTFGLNHN